MMTRAEAKKFAIQKYRDGFPVAVIQKELAQNYKSQLTGKPLTTGGVTSLIHEEKWKGKPKKKGRGRPRSGNGNGHISQKKAARYDALVTCIKMVRGLDIDSGTKEAITDLLVENLS